MAFNLISRQNNDSPLFYTDKDSPAEKACVGHLRGDFGRQGREFWTTWFDNHTELSTPAFKSEFQIVIDGLRNAGILKSYDDMCQYCREHPEARLEDKWRNSYGFKLDGKQHDYFIRCNLVQGDYQLYVYAYQRELLEKAFSEPQERLNAQSKKRRQEPER